MARIRTIKPEFLKHEDLFDAELASGLPLRLAFAGLWTQCDREGRFRWRPRQLKTDILPYDDVDFAAVLNALAKYGFVLKYEVDGNTYGYVPTWHKHQHVNQREKDSELPDPSTCTHVTAHGEMEGERERKGRGKEGERERETRAREIDCEFHEAFWPEYPNKVGKPKALQSFTIARRKHELGAIIAGLRRYIETKPPDRQWLNPATFLNQERFLDAPAATGPPTSRTTLAGMKLQQELENGKWNGGPAIRDEHSPDAVGQLPEPAARPTNISQATDDGADRETENPAKARRRPP